MRSAEQLVAELNARDASAHAEPGRQQADDAAAERTPGVRGGAAACDTARRGTSAERLGGPTAAPTASRRTTRSRRPATQRPPDAPHGAPHDAPHGAPSDGPPPDDPAAVDLPADPEAVARFVCLRMLERKARSRSELEQALAKRAVPDDVARAVLDRFTEVGLIDDAGLAATVAGAQHRERGLARRAVAAKLRQRGFDDDTVQAAVSGIDADDERDRARALVERKLRSLAGLPVEVRTRRLVGLLARKGYSSGLAYEVVRAALADRGDDIPDAGPDTGLD